MNWTRHGTRFKATKADRVFPLVVSALRAWHKMGARVDLGNHSVVSSMPIFHNKHMLDEHGGVLIPPVNVLRHFSDTLMDCK